MSHHLNFDSWSQHYATNVAIAVKAWIEQNGEMRGTSMYWQMEDILAKAMERAS